MRSRSDYIFSNHNVRLVSASSSTTTPSSASSAGPAGDHPRRRHIWSGWCCCYRWLGFVAVLVGYDLLRRTTCIGDPWGLGGPGFTTPITPASGNVMILQCPIVKKGPVVGPRG